MNHFFSFNSHLIAERTDYQFILVFPQNKFNFISIFLFYKKTQVLEVEKFFQKTKFTINRKNNTYF